MGLMAAPTPDQAVEAARQAEEQRLEAIRRLADARQNVEQQAADAKQQRADLEKQLASERNAAEHDARLAWKMALSAGWTPADLRKIGFPAPTKKRRSTPRQANNDAKTDEQSPTDNSGDNTAQDAA